MKVLEKCQLQEAVEEKEEGLNSLGKKHPAHSSQNENKVKKGSFT